MYLTEREVEPATLAKLATSIERNVFGSEVGVQDAAAAAHGGLLRIVIDRDGAAIFQREPDLEEHFWRAIGPSLILVDTHQRRAAKEVLGRMSSVVDLIAVGERLREQVRSFETIIRAGDVEAYGRALSAHWVQKRTQMANMTSSDIDDLYDTALSLGCAGGKLVGAGGGGHLLFAGNRSCLEALAREVTRRALTVRSVERDHLCGVRLTPVVHRGTEADASS